MESKIPQIQNESIFTFKYIRHLFSCHYLRQEKFSEPPFLSHSLNSPPPPPKCEFPGSGLSISYSNI